VLKHLTFYTLNRVYLIIAILFSSLYPQINLSDFAQRHQQLTQPVQTVLLNWQAPAEMLVKPLAKPDYWIWFEGIFWIGVALLTIRLATQLFSLYRLYRNSKPGNIGDHPVRLIGDNIGPFSFWRSIYINPAKLSPADLKGVLEHEQVHVNELHTVDILLAELSTIFYWFNPGVWLMKKAVRENIEFITDRKILKKGMDSKQYQYSLVSISLATTSNTIVNHFNISTIKKRIIMMNTKRSSGYKLTRYVFLPAVIALLLVFSLSKAAITKTGLRTIKVLDSAMSINPIVNNTQSFALAAKHKGVAKHSLRPNDTIYSGKSKDGHKSFMVTSDTRSDSVNYVINGVLSTKTDLKALDPARIKSVEFVDGKDAKKFMPGLDESKQTLFVTTEDSETGKALKAKIDKEMGFGKVAKVTNISITRDGSSVEAPSAVGSGVSVSTNSSSSGSDDNAPVVISDGNNVSSSVVVVPDLKINTSVSTKATKSRVYTTNAAKGTVVLSNIALDSAHITLDSGSTRKSFKNVYVVGYPQARATTIRVEPSISMSDKLIIIDGKQATDKEMKNLKVSDIKSITERMDDKTKEKYGDKAKNGVLYITTKE
jgi:bla regulator protein BlaR1